ncbi:hypothetical protein [Actinomadura madurae]|uniref:hypothetical protein n=1 Tax=Actinomadura madurae TaxID=1993 RepID=UPI0020D24AB3|nr:hypothetical protein [Actinomadura madurae]MCQ0006133.1 hypothetical protein [Actinomadura madurae]MCQ0018583.1 hypothetical protein [Actinomadura madurae]
MSATSASAWSGSASARKIAVMSPNASCRPPVWGGLSADSQPGLRPSRIAWPVSCATMSSDRHVWTASAGGRPCGVKDRNFSAFAVRL